MNKVLIAILLAFSSGAFAKAQCYEKIQCKSYNDGRSAFKDASGYYHWASERIPDLVYMRAIFYDEDGKKVVFGMTSESLWEKEVRSGYRGNSYSKYISGLKKSYRINMKNCEAMKEEYQFLIPRCDKPWPLK